VERKLEKRRGWIWSLVCCRNYRPVQSFPVHLVVRSGCGRRADGCLPVAQLLLFCLCPIYFLNLERVAKQPDQAGVWILKGSVKGLGQDSGPGSWATNTHLLMKYLGGPWPRLALTKLRQWRGGFHQISKTFMLTHAQLAKMREQCHKKARWDTLLSCQTSSRPHLPSQNNAKKKY
jgi:hypothetical protein